MASIETDPIFAPGIRRLDQESDFKDILWQFSGPLSGFKGYYNRLGGYVHSSDAMEGIWTQCVALGVKFLLGEKGGRVISLIRTKEGACMGVKTIDGNFHAADLTICATGAYSAALLPSIGEFTTARCWPVVHVHLTEEETDFLRGIPTVNIRDLGFFFEPDPKTRLFKLCPLGAGYTNTDRDTGISLPPTTTPTYLQDFIPTADEKKLRQLLRETFPWMAERAFVEKKLCWFSDTRDSDFCIDFVPGTDKSIICLSGDSGHGFKMMPIVGKWVVALINAGQQDEPRWQWRTTNLTGQSWGNAVSWRVGNEAELRDLHRSRASL